MLWALWTTCCQYASLHVYSQPFTCSHTMLVDFRAVLGDDGQSEGTLRAQAAARRLSQLRSVLATLDTRCGA